MSNAYIDRLENRIIFTKVCNVGTIPMEWAGPAKKARLFLTIELRKGQQNPEHIELSITGVSGPRANGDAWGSCGQNSGDLLEVTEFAPGWDRALAEETYEVWKRWHLNGMTAGSPAQEQWKRDNVFPGYPTDHYEWVKAGLAAAGLDPDPNYLVPSEGTKMVPYGFGFGKCKTQHHACQFEKPGDMVPYKYGHAWLYEALPDDVLEFIHALPQSEVAHPWGRH